MTRGAPPSVTAVAAGDGVTLSGTAGPVEAGAQASQLLVTAQTADGPAQFLVPVETAGVTVTPLHSVDLVRRFARIAFDDVVVPASARVGASSSVDDVERQLQWALVMQTAEMVGAAQWAFDVTVEWTFDRYSFGRPLASYQELKHRFADMKTVARVPATASAAAPAREVQGELRQRRRWVSAAKAYTGEYLAELVQDCVQMHGGIGLTWEHDLHLYLRRIAADRNTYGTPADHRQRSPAPRREAV